MAISFVGQSQAASTTVAVPTHQVGDLILIFSWRNTTTAPTLPGGFTNESNGSSNANSFRVGYRFATSTSDTSGKWTNATTLQCVVYSGVGSVGNSTGSTATASSTLTIPALTLNDTSGNDWIVNCLGSKQTTSLGVAAGMTQRGTSQVGTSGMSNISDSNGGRSSWSATTATSGASATYARMVIELIAAATTTPTNSFFIMMS